MAVSYVKNSIPTFFNQHSSEYIPFTAGTENTVQYIPDNATPHTHTRIESGLFQPKDGNLSQQIESISPLVESFSEAFGADSASVFGWQVTPEMVVAKVCLYADLTKK